MPSAEHYTPQPLPTTARTKSQAKFQEAWKQTWTRTLFKRSGMFASGSLAQRTTNFSVLVTRTVQKFPGQTPSSGSKKHTCLPWHKAQLPAALQEKLLCPPQRNIPCSRHARTPITCDLHRAAHATASSFPPLGVRRSTSRASCPTGSSAEATCASRSRCSELIAPVFPFGKLYR